MLPFKTFFHEITTSFSKIFTFLAIGYVSSTGAMMYVLSGAIVSIEDLKLFETFGLVEDFIDKDLLMGDPTIKLHQMNLLYISLR